MAPPAIPGLRYYPDYLDQSAHDEVLAVVDSQKWQARGGRGMQIHGHNYHHTRGIYRIGDLPGWANDLAVRLWRDGLTPAVSDQVIANEYPPGAGIHPHVDLEDFDDTIVSLSLGSTCVMQFTEHGSHRVEEWLLEPCSALVLAGEARHTWTHGIPARQSDLWMGRDLPRGRRVSLTFRRMRPPTEAPAA
jgi:alkylated DNA repair dioxygenase AlkB